MKCIYFVCFEDEQNECAYKYNTVIHFDRIYNDKDLKDLKKEISRKKFGDDREITILSLNSLYDN